MSIENDVIFPAFGCLGIERQAEELFLHGVHGSEYYTSFKLANPLRVSYQGEFYDIKAYIRLTDTGRFELKRICECTKQGKIYEKRS